MRVARDPQKEGGGGGAGVVSEVSVSVSKSIELYARFCPSSRMFFSTMQKAF